MKKRILSFIAVLIALLAVGVNNLQAQEDIRREVTLYNPFKPSLNKASKLNFMPLLSDTVITAPEFKYSINARPFMPEYELRTISAARLQPDPLPKLYKGFLNLGFGNYFSPLAELSISSDRSRNSNAGVYLSHESSFGKLKINDNIKVYAGYMDNSASLFWNRFFRRTAVSADIDFNHIRRYAYGGDTIMLAPAEIDKDSLRIEYIHPRAGINIYSIRLDSSKLYFDVGFNYDLLYQNSIFYQHSAALEGEFGYDFDIFYAGLDMAYKLYTIPNIEDKFRHLVYLNPTISKRSTNWNFRLGLKLIADARYYNDPSAPLEYKTRLFFYPDLRFQFSIMPGILSMYVGLDGEYSNNNAAEMIYANPFVITHNTNGLVEPSDDLYTILPTDTKLRIKGGFTGHATLNTRYNLNISYSMFDDMVFFINDTYQGRGFSPVYDNGELLDIRAGFSTQLNKRISLSGKGGFYNYVMESVEKPWHKPSWDGEMILEYNLRDKILGKAGIYALSERYGRFGPMPYSGSTDYEVAELPMYFSLNLGLEYRYTKILSFWARINNIALNRYYEWNFYPAQRFLFMAGFTYSL